MNTSFLPSKMARIIFAIMILLGTFAFTPQTTQAATNAAGSWTATGALKVARKNHTSTLLPNGMVLIAGGDSNPTAMNSVEIYVPEKNGSTLMPAMNSARYSHTATLLPDGTVLVTGGRGAAGTLNTAELYDPVGKTWTATPTTMIVARSEHTATLLPDGNVLIVGGANTVPVQTAEIYNPVAKTFTATAGTLNTARSWHTATRLPNGKVLIVGGYNAGVLSSAEVYDLVSQTFGLTDTPLGLTRQKHTATLLPDGRVLIAGGTGIVTTYNNAEIYDYTFGTRGRFTPVTATMQTRRREHSAALLPDGRVLLAGGFGDSILNHVDLFDPLTNTFTAGPAMLTPRMNFAVTLLPNGRLLSSGGWSDSGLTASAETFSAPQAYYRWKYTTGSLSIGTESPTATLLVNGKVLVAGGIIPQGNNLIYSNRTALYDPVAQTFTMGQMNFARNQHIATALPNGRVLIFGGIGPDEAPIPNVELYDPITNSFIDLGSFPSRLSSAAVLLPNGRVLVTCGYVANGSTYNSAVLYAPSYSGGNGEWFTAVSLTKDARQEHTATLLRNGKVLLAGGTNTRSAELYDPNAAANAFSYTGNMIAIRRTGARATLLPSGEVLLTGGSNGTSTQASAEIYDPQTGTFRATTSMSYPRSYHSALLLPNGKVLVTGGDGDTAGIQSHSEIYDPATETWTRIGSLNQARYRGADVVLPNGTPIVVGGLTHGHAPVASAEILIAPFNYAVPLVKK